MKVVLFCGGMGMRLRDYSHEIPKPLVEVGPQPILWHLMKYYANYGHKDFVLCLGHGAKAIKDYFLNYNENVTNDFVLSEGGKRIDLLQKDLEDWRITFVDTGLNSPIGVRLQMVRKHLEGEDMFLANYADGLSDLDLASYVDNFVNRKKIACFVSVPAPHTFHIVHADDDHHVLSLEAVGRSVVRINGGFFVFRKEIFHYMRPGEDLVQEPFDRLMRKRELLDYPYDGFWRNMDTFKDKMVLEGLLAEDKAPWQVWRSPC